MTGTRAKALWAMILKQFGTPLAEYAGAYTHAGYGVITITVQDGGLSARLDQLNEPLPLEHERYEVFRPKLAPGGTLSRWESRRLTFLYDRGGKVDRVTIPLETSVPDIVFRRTGH